MDGKVEEGGGGKLSPAACRQEKKTERKKSLPVFLPKKGPRTKRGKVVKKRTLEGLDLLP